MSEAATISQNKLEISCDVKGATNFQVDNMKTVGYIYDMKFPISGDTLAKDLSFKDPENPTGGPKMKVVGIISNVKWGGDLVDPIELEGYLSYANSTLFGTWIDSPGGGPDVDISFIVKKYDKDGKKYFQRFHTGGNALNTIVTKGVAPWASEEPNREFTDPPIYQFKISLSPKKGQELHSCKSMNQKLVLPWGVDQSA